MNNTIRPPRVFDILKTSLQPISFTWEKICWFRRFLYTYEALFRYKFEVPIISVGNMTLGGTGKTPFTIRLSRYFYNKGKKVMILSRGYKGVLEHGRGIIRSDQTLGLNPFDYGDEAVITARRTKNASIVVGKDRGANLCYYFDKEKPDVVLLDDGHQHLQIERNLNIVLFDFLMPLESYRVAPLGYMREGFSGLADCDIVIFGRVDQAESSKAEKLKQMLLPYLKDDVVFAKTRHRPIALVNSVTSKRYDLARFLGKKVICVAGIATPRAFFLTIESLGYDIVKTLPFPDHHYFTELDAVKIMKLVKENNAVIITTEKDIDKLRCVIVDSRIYYLEVEIEFLDGEDAVFKAVDKAVSFYF